MFVKRKSILCKSEFFNNYATIKEAKYRIFRKTASDKLDALKNNSYTAYEFNAPEKLWCSVHVNDGEEEQDHTEIDDEGNLYDFYIDCGGIVFSVGENEYKAVTNRVLIVLLFLGKKTTLEYFASDGRKEK